MYNRGINITNKNTYCPRSDLSLSDDPGTYFPAARLISLRKKKSMQWL